MKILLVKDVKGQGKAGDIVNVSDGYARNYLLARKLGVLAEGKALNEALQKKESEAYQLQKRKDKAVADKAKLDTATIHVKVKAGESGKIFGSVTSKEIADQLVALGYEVDKKDIALEAPIKQVGRQMVDIKLFGGVTARVNVVVEAE